MDALILKVAEALLKHGPEYIKPQAENIKNRRAKSVLRKMLKSKKWRARSLEHMSRLLPVFSEDEIRSLLVEVGAVRVEDLDEKEMWALSSSETGRKYSDAMIYNHPSGSDEPPKMV